MMKNRTIKAYHKFEGPFSSLYVFYYKIKYICDIVISKFMNLPCPNWQVEGKVDTLCITMAVMEFILLTSQKRPLVDIIVHWFELSSQSIAPQFSSDAQSREHWRMVL